MFPKGATGPSPFLPRGGPRCRPEVLLFPADPDRAERAQNNADRSGQGDEGRGEDEKGVGALEESDGG